MQPSEWAGSKKLPAREILRLHEAVLFELTHPVSAAALKQSRQRMTGILTPLLSPDKPNTSLQNKLANTGIAGTEIISYFSLPLTCWLHNQFKQDVFYFGSDCDDDTAVSVFQLLLPGIQYYRITQGNYTAAKRMQYLAGTKDPELLLQWLLDLFTSSPLPQPVKEDLFLRLKIFVCWKLNNPAWSRSGLQLPDCKPSYIKTLIRYPDAASVLQKKLPAPLSLTPIRQNEYLHIMRATLTLLCRETDPLSFGEANTVIAFDLGRGLKVVLNGMVTGKQFSLESYIGFMAFRNGIPLAYGGGWLFGDRCKIGVNIFPAFRKGESAWVFAQVLRCYHQHYKVSYFSVKPYQFGEKNPEGLKSGAYWFYYRLGFRSATPELEQLASTEAEKIKSGRQYRTPLSTLKAFTKAPVILQTSKKKKLHPSAEEISEAVSILVQTTFAGHTAKALQAGARQLYAVCKRRFPPSAARDNMCLFILYAGDSGSWSKKRQNIFRKLAESKISGQETDYHFYLQKFFRLPA